MLDVIVLLLLLLLVFGALPIHAYGRDCGYYPSGIIAAILLVVALSLMHAAPMRTGAGASLPAVLLNARRSSRRWTQTTDRTQLTALLA